MDWLQNLCITPTNLSKEKLQSSKRWLIGSFFRNKITVAASYKPLLQLIQGHLIGNVHILHRSPLGAGFDKHKFP